MLHIANGATAEQRMWKALERVLFGLFLVGSCITLARHIDHVQGFDGNAYLEALHRIQLWKPLPGVRETFYSFHPFLGFYLNRIFMLFGISGPVSVQIVSWLGVTSAIVLLRQTLKHIRMLWCLPGVCFLVLAEGLPLYVYLSTEIGHDSHMLFWSMCVLYASIVLFWDPPHAFKKKSQWVIPVIALVLMVGLVGGLLTKFSGSINIAIPLLVIAVRHRRIPLVLMTYGLIVFALSLCTVVAVGPFYYERYYQTEGQFFPGQMEWTRQEDLQKVRADRDAAPAHFILHMMRLPEHGIRGVQEPLLDSFFHVLWFSTWKRDGVLGEQSPASSTLSDIYSTIFLLLVFLGAMHFLLLAPCSKSAWYQLGWILLGIGMLYSLALLSFGYSYPLWDWRPFKAKYIAVGLLWIPYFIATALEGEKLLLLKTVRMQRCAGFFFIIFLAAYLAANHMLPVY